MEYRFRLRLYSSFQLNLLKCTLYCFLLLLILLLAAVCVGWGAAVSKLNVSSRCLAVSLSLQQCVSLSLSIYIFLSQMKTSSYLQSHLAPSFRKQTLHCNLIHTQIHIHTSAYIFSRKGKKKTTRSDQKEMPVPVWRQQTHTLTTSPKHTVNNVSVKCIFSYSLSYGHHYFSIQIINLCGNFPIFQTKKQFSLHGYVLVDNFYHTFHKPFAITNKPSP